MLSVDDGLASGLFTGLKQKRIRSLADGGRLQTEHASQHHRPFPHTAGGHHHPPVRGGDLILTPRPRLLDVHDEGLSVEHEGPGAPD